MSGASAETGRVAFVNANWTPGPPGGDGTFGVMVVTEDGERRTLEPSPAAFTALVALAAAGTVLLWDPDGPTLIAANLVGEWLTADGAPARRST